MIDFTKMHGLGNDFVIIDARKSSIKLTSENIQMIADRNLGVGCDQIMIIYPAKNSGDVYLKILNPDGSESGACGNGTRCVASVLLSELKRDMVHIETASGILSAFTNGNMISVNMGASKFMPEDIPFNNSELHLDDLLYVPFSEIIEEKATLISMGNPHAVFFVPDCELVDLEKIGPLIEHHSCFPNRTNVEFVQQLSGERLRMRVWERGVGVTKACGSGACAAAVAGARRGLVNTNVEILLDGGSLWVEILDYGEGLLKRESSGKNSVIMTGPASHSFSGKISRSLLKAGMA